MKNIHAFVLSLFLFSTPLYADNYVGLTTGVGNVSVSGYESSVPSKLYYGVEAGRDLAIEFGMTNLGRFDVPGATNTYIKTDGIELSVLKKFGGGGGPVDFYAKLGVYAWSLDAYLYGSPFAKDNGSAVTYGLGASFKIANSLTALAEYQVYPGISDADISLLGLGLNYHF